LFDVSKGVDGVTPYLLGDKDYPLIDWNMTLFKDNEQHTILKLYNRKHKQGCSIGELSNSWHNNLIYMSSSYWYVYMLLLVHNLQI